MNAIGAEYVANTVPSTNGNGHKADISPLTGTTIDKTWKEFAYGYEHGLSMIPVDRGHKIHPPKEWERYGQKRATIEEIGQWAKSGRYRRVNPAVVLGKLSDVIDLEVDGDKGYEFIQSKGIPKTWTYKSPSGRRKFHYLFKYPTGHDYISKAIKEIHSEVDLLTDGCYAMFPGSQHPDGGLYEWVNSPDDVALSECPNWLIDWITNRQEQKKRADEALSMRKVEACTESSDEAVKWAKGALRTQAKEVTSAKKGTRNNKLSRASYTLAPYVKKGKLTEGEVRSVLLQSCQQNGSIAEDGLEQFNQTFNSGLKAGWNNPVTPMPTQEVYGLPASLKPFAKPEVQPEIQESKPKRRLPFTKVSDMAQETGMEMDWICEPFIPAGTVVGLESYPKQGKTTFTLAICKAIAEGKVFLGEQTKQTPIIYLTEQPKNSFMFQAREAGLEECEHLYVVCLSDTNVFTWHETLQEVTAHALEVGAKLIVIDTLLPFSRVKDENSASEANGAMSPIQEIANKHGISVLVLRHERKSLGDTGMAGRGSSAYTGYFDHVFSLRKPEEKTTNGRVIGYVGRCSDIPAEIAVELTDEGYRLLGDSKALTRQSCRQDLLSILPMTEVDALPEKEIKSKLPNVSKGTLNSVLNEGIKNDNIRRVGKGSKGDPFRYWQEIFILPNPK